MPTYLGITWDHPRGKNALRAAADREQASGSELDLRWEDQPLEGFETHPIGELARRYDLIVLDHPHLGEAIASSALTPIDDVVAPELIAAWREQSIGQSFASYAAAGRQWALPLDAATQVAVYKPGLIETPPRTWVEVNELALAAPVALSLAGPHAFLTFASIHSALASGHKFSAAELVSGSAAAEALELMRAIGARSASLFADQNPIAMLGTMRDSDEIAYCPLIYGYVNYSGEELRFSDAPAADGNRTQPGSVLGGTGLALSRRCEPTDGLIRHLEWLMSDEAQRDFIPRHDGQPSSRSAWLDPVLDRQSCCFYSGTIATVEASWIRPRDPGYISFQNSASATVRDVVLKRVDVHAGLRMLRELAITVAQIQDVPE
jgi:multiple sugar transport system substrate-binding protein